MNFTTSEIHTYYDVAAPGLKQTSERELRGPCPIHNGKDANFSVNTETGFAYCHSQCNQGWDIIGFEMERSGKDFARAKEHVFRIVGRPQVAWEDRNVEAVYTYVDESGKPQYDVVRQYGKQFFQRRRNPDGSHSRGLGGVPPLPFRADKLEDADAVFVVEGEKDVLSMESLGMVATCNSGGAGNFKPELVPHFVGKDITILPDNDEAGTKHAQKVAESLASVARSIKIVELPGLPAKGDVTDFINAGGTVAQIKELCRNAPPWSRDKANGSQRFHHSFNGNSAAGEMDDWPKPEPLKNELPPVEGFSEDLLPASFRPLVTDVTERMQVPMDFPAVVSMLCLAGVVNRRALIQPKANDRGWVVVPNLWGGIIAPPGFMKSTVISAISKPLATIEEFWRKAFNAKLEEHKRLKDEADLRLSAWKEVSKAAIKKNASVPIRPDNTLAEPTPKRLLTNDGTFEKLHELMAQNPAGILLIRDELTGWWSTLDKPGREGERAFCLECWNGENPFTVDRIGRGTVHVPHCCMSMLGGIQPGRLRSYLVDALKDGPANDGLIQRFQLLVWSDTTPDWKYVDRAPDAAAEQQVECVFRRLVEMDAESPPRFRFAPDGQELFVEWLAELEAKVRRDELHPALISHLSKYRSLMPSLALLFELADRAAGGFVSFVGSNSGDSQNFQVSLEHAKQAAAWCDYLESHARRIYSCIVKPQLRAAQELADKIKRRKVGAGGSFACRNVYRMGWEGLDTPEAVKQAAEILQDAGWVRDVSTESGPFGGRPANRYQVNPRVRE